MNWIDIKDIYPGRNQIVLIYTTFHEILPVQYYYIEDSNGKLLNKYFTPYFEELEKGRYMGIPEKFILKWLNIHEDELDGVEFAGIGSGNNPYGHKDAIDADLLDKYVEYNEDQQ